MNSLSPPSARGPVLVLTVVGIALLVTMTRCRTGRSPDDGGRAAPPVAGTVADAAHTGADRATPGTRWFRWRPRSARPAGAAGQSDAGGAFPQPEERTVQAYRAQWTDYRRLRQFGDEAFDRLDELLERYGLTETQRAAVCRDLHGDLVRLRFYEEQVADATANAEEDAVRFPETSEEGRLHFVRAWTARQALGEQLAVQHATLAAQTSDPDFLREFLAIHPVGPLPRPGTALAGGGQGDPLEE